MNANERQSILIVDDETNNRTVLMEMFKNHHKVMLAKTGEMALELATKHLPDLILLDVLLPGLNGYETLERLKANDTTREIPVVFITALDGSVDEEKGLLLGAVDYITKPFHPAIVRARVRNHLRSVRQRQLLERFAMFDTLTELPNRRRLERTLSSAYPPGSTVSIAMLDIDHFKRINDTYGHSCGDKVLLQIAEVLRTESAAAHCQASRYGGEEFVLWMSDRGTESAKDLCERVRRAIEALEIELATGIFVQVTASVGGISARITDDGKAPEGILEGADQALYEAKRSGRNCVIWGPV
jgi:diguanylate cyclase (GGDEF)-like protein